MGTMMNPNPNKVQFSNGATTPSPQLQTVANNLVSKTDPQAFNAVKTAPTGTQKVGQLMGAVQKGFSTLNPNVQKQFPMADVAKAAANSLGMPQVMKGIQTQ